MASRLAAFLLAASVLTAPVAALAQDGAPEAAIATALANEDRDAALELIRERADVNAAQSDGTTALMWAAYHGDVELVETLLRRGAEPNLVNDYGASALSEASKKGDADVIALLLEAEADPNIANAEGQTPLMNVARTGNVAAAQLLIEAGADPNAMEQWGGQTALMWAAAQGQPDMIDTLIAAGADPNAQAFIRDWGRRITSEPRPKDMDRGGFTALLYAAREGCAECVRRLAAGGADLNQHDADRATPLILALMSLHFDTAATLIEAGADINKWDLYGQSPLYVAIDMNTTPAGGRPDVPSLDENKPLDIARILLDLGANPNLQLKVRPPYRNVIQDRGGDNVLSAGATPLLRAAKAGDNDAIRLLLSYDNVLVDLPTATGVTPLLIAGGMGHGSNPTRGRYKTEDQGVESIRLLTAAGADINAQNEDGQTAAHAAVQKGWPKVIEVLAELGADLTIADDNGVTPLAMAQGSTDRERFQAPAEPKPEIAALLERLIAGEPAAAALASETEPS